jgi:hypothetical protein
MLKQATKSFTAGVLPPDTPVVKATPNFRGAEQPTPNGDPRLEQIFLEGRARKSVNTGVIQPTTDNQQTSNNKPKNNHENQCVGKPNE